MLSMICKSLLNMPRDEIFVMGNQSADLDSCVSAISLSLLISLLNPELRSLPLIQGEREDLKLRPEISALFAQAEVDTESLTFLSELNPPNLEGKNMILVDHNVPEKDNLTFSIVGIIDHHRDGGRFNTLPLRDIRVCGSCGSIISAYWEKCIPEMPYSQRLLLAGVIEVDTGGLNREWGKTTDLDRFQLHRLVSQLKIDDRIFLKTLNNIKNDLEHLSMSDHLRRDYKDFPFPQLGGGISSVPLSIDQFFQKGFYNQAELESFCRERCPGFLLIMHTQGSPLRRELSLYSPKGLDGDQRAFLVKNALETLDTEPYRFDKQDRQAWFSYRLHDPTTSRKVLVPLLLNALN